MTNPKEIAIEKVAKVACLHEWKSNNLETLATGKEVVDARYKNYLPLAEAIIDVLGIEFVDDDALVMNDEKKISPLPWDMNLHYHIDEQTDFTIIDAKGGEIADLYNFDTRFDNATQNAQFIVKACNSYHDNQQALAEQAKRIAELENAVNHAFIAYCMAFETPMTDSSYWQGQIKKKLKHLLDTKGKE